MQRALMRPIIQWLDNMEAMQIVRLLGGRNSMAVGTEMRIGVINLDSQRR